MATQNRRKTKKTKTPLSSAQKKIIAARDKIIMANVDLLIERKGITQKALAKKMQTDESYFGKWRKDLSIGPQQFARIVLALGVTPEALMCTQIREATEMEISETDVKQWEFLQYMKIAIENGNQEMMKQAVRVAWQELGMGDLPLKKDTGIASKK